MVACHTSALRQLPCPFGPLNPGSPTRTRFCDSRAFLFPGLGSRDDEDYNPEIHKYNLLIVMQFSRPAFPPSYRTASRLSMDLADWVQADSFWKCIREGGGDTGERAVSRISFLDDEGNTFIYNMEEAMKNHICLELAKALVELWRTGVQLCATDVRVLP